MKNKDEYIEKLECLLAHTYDVIDELQLPSKYQPNGLKNETIDIMDNIKKLGLHTKTYG